MKKSFENELLNVIKSNENRCDLYTNNLANILFKSIVKLNLVYTIVYFVCLFLGWYRYERENGFFGERLWGGTGYERNEDY